MLCSSMRFLSLFGRSDFQNVEVGIAFQVAVLGSFRATSGLGEPPSAAHRCAQALRATTGLDINQVVLNDGAWPDLKPIFEQSLQALSNFLRRAAETYLASSLSDPNCRKGGVVEDEVVAAARDNPLFSGLALCVTSARQLFDKPLPGLTNWKEVLGNWATILNASLVDKNFLAVCPEWFRERVSTLTGSAHADIDKLLVASAAELTEFETIVKQFRPLTRACADWNMGATEDMFEDTTANIKDRKRLLDLCLRWRAEASRLAGVTGVDSSSSGSSSLELKTINGNIRKIELQAVSLTGEAASLITTFGFAQIFISPKGATPRAACEKMIKFAASLGCGVSGLPRSLRSEVERALDDASASTASGSMAKLSASTAAGSMADGSAASGSMAIVSAASGSMADGSAASGSFGLGRRTAKDIAKPAGKGTNGVDQKTKKHKKSKKDKNKKDKKKTKGQEDKKDKNDKKEKKDKKDKKDKGSKDVGAKKKDKK
jgi:hypothetical protein